MWVYHQIVYAELTINTEWQPKSKTSSRNRGATRGQAKSEDQKVASKTSCMTEEPQETSLRMESANEIQSLASEIEEQREDRLSIEGQLKPKTSHSDSGAKDR